MKPFIITNHALKRFRERYYALHGKLPDQQVLQEYLKRAEPERPKSRNTRFHLLKRTITNGPARFLHYKGWRFVVVPGKTGNHVVTVERVRPEENYFSKDAGVQ